MDVKKPSDCSRLNWATIKIRSASFLACLVCTGYAAAYLLKHAMPKTLSVTWCPSAFDRDASGVSPPTSSILNRHATLSLEQENEEDSMADGGARLGAQAGQVSVDRWSLARATPSGSFATSRRSRRGADGHKYPQNDTWTQVSDRSREGTNRWLSSRHWLSARLQSLQLDSHCRAETGNHRSPFTSSISPPNGREQTRRPDRLQMYPSTFAGFARSRSGIGLLR